MNINDPIPELDRKGLREFGLVTAAIVAVLFGLFFPWLLAKPIPGWPWIIAGVLGSWALLAPQSLNPVYRGWMRVGLVIGAVMSRVVLSLVFFLVITPMGLVMRLSKHDPMRRAFDPNAETYRISSKIRAKTHMERPF